MISQIGSENPRQLIANKPIEIVLQKVEEIKSKRPTDKEVLEMRKGTPKMIMDSLFAKQEKFFLQNVLREIRRLFGLRFGVHFGSFTGPDTFGPSQQYKEINPDWPEDFLKLSDEEIITLVDYMIEESRLAKKYVTLKLLLLSLTIFSLMKVQGYLMDRSDELFSKPYFKSDLAITVDILKKRGIDAKTLVMDSVKEAREKRREL